MELEFIQRNWHLFAALFVIIALLLYDPIRRRLAGIKSVSVMDAPRLISHELAIVVDVSEAKEYKNGHIPNSINIPMTQLNKDIGKLEQHKSKPVVVSCRSGNRSSRAASILSRNKFHNVYTLSGGLLAWQKENLPTER